MLPLGLLAAAGVATAFSKASDNSRAPNKARRSPIAGTVEVWADIPLRVRGVWQHLAMARDANTIWEKLAECVQVLPEPFSRSEIYSWFRRHYPEVNQGSLSAHIQAARSDAPAKSRAAFAFRTPLVTQVSHGQYRRFIPSLSATSADADSPTPVVAVPPVVERPIPAARPSGVEDRERGVPEKRVQTLVVAYLMREGWTLAAEANTDTRERGIDVVAERNGQRVGIEVKGYPGTAYSDPRRAGEVKPSHPSAQAGTYFAQAVLTAMRLRANQPEMVSVVAVPDVPRYRSLATEVQGSLKAAGIAVWLMDADGGVDIAVPCGW